ncbi:hypothetical protein EPUS_07931 [Endocarpon pusillum Z07020]|uniref:Uncharacterized protein n=1 Tax=Endocarpon pusillum (strain Z07020 / HMAS-L-300199) TaxID=1263415 RepID=U1I195_ENDPU|nr:uncharacterized protein EPUS_07931 [Endocarpon pusillum Z07020]ERF77025.1 hypothetical protein EPUS_07931 [Endocarpon pusillum Z07020]
MNRPVPQDTYLLLERFSMPHGNSTADAVSLSRGNGLILISLYTLMIGVTIRQFWTLIVLIGVTIFMRKKHSHNRGAATVGVWNAQASPSNVAMLAARYVLHMKGEVWYPLMWTLLATVVVGAISAASILLPRLVNIGTVAPVNPRAVFVPLRDGSNQTATALTYALEGPSALRAVGAADTIGSEASVVVEQEEEVGGSGQDPGIRINYRYGVTASDFGLQHAPGLVMNVTGSCVTEYSWLQETFYERTGENNSEIALVEDTYVPWNNIAAQRRVSNLDNGPPFAYFVSNPATQGEGLGNTTFAIVPSSLWRDSFTASTDPWYLTRNSSEFYAVNENPFIVVPGRPALSCWETAIWSYGDSSVDLAQLHQVPGLHLPDVLINIFDAFLIRPMMPEMGIRLGRSSLASATAALGATFNAGGSSIQNDITRLVNASYIATRNVLADTTLFSNPIGSGIINIARQTNGEPQEGVGDFVVSSPDIMTLSVRALIIVPVVLLGVFLLTYLIGILPAPWRMTEALHATVLYSHLHEKAGDGAQAEWKRQSLAAYSRRTGDAPISPLYDENNGELLWAQNERQTQAAAVPASEVDSGKSSSAVLGTTEKSGGGTKTLGGLAGTTVAGAVA